MQLKQVILGPGEHAQAIATLGQEGADLVLVFGALPFFTEPATCAAVRQAFPDAVIAGCSTAGEIGGDRTYDGHCVITAIRFGSSHARAASTTLDGMDDSYGAGARLAAALPQQGLQGILLFGPGVAVNGSALVRGLQSGVPEGVPVSGGLAGDGGAFRKTWTLGPAGCADDQAVAVGLYGAAIQLSYGSFAGWDPFGPVRKVTRAKDNVLFELDGERALDIYRRYLGAHAAGLPGSGLLFPFEMLDAAHAQSGVLRTILGIDAEAGSLTLAGNIDPDGYLRLMHTTTDKLIDGAEQAARTALRSAHASDSHSLAILVSCIGRKLIMGDRVDEEVEAVADMLGQPAIAGFYSNGEIGECGPGGASRLHNQTMTITQLSEA